MHPDAGPTAATISLKEALALLDGEFSGMAEGIGQRRYAFWLGSGISRGRVDDLSRVVRRVLLHIDSHIDRSNPYCAFRRALEEAVELGNLSPADRATVDFDRPIAEWQVVETLVANLCSQYSRLLDIRVNSQAEEDYLLWNGVDVPSTFAPANATPDCEHYCIAIMAIEGVIEDVASANWDGLIEAATQELTDNSGAVLRVCVQADDFREPPGLARLLKFHGCAVRAAANPARYRSLLIARFSQITGWAHNPAYTQMQAELVTLATTKRTLMIGLSAQDFNIQNIFAAANNRMTWQWPCDPPAHVFAEDRLGGHQVNILRMVYSEAYRENGPQIDASALFRAYAKQAMTALVVHVLCAKICTYARHAYAPGLTPQDHDVIGRGIVFIRDAVADAASSDRFVFIQALIAATARVLALFQNGELPVGGSRTYSPLNRTPIHMIANDPAMPTSGIREMAVALGILGLGQHDAIWRIRYTGHSNPEGGSIDVESGSSNVRVYFTANGRASVQLEISSLISEEDKDVVIIHSTEPVSRMARSPSAAPGRTGQARLRSVGMSELLRSSTGINDLRDRFREQAAL